MADPTLREFSPIKCVEAERVKQDVKWGVQNHNAFGWLAILAEEFGEASKSVCSLLSNNDTKDSIEAIIENLEYELIQTAAVCIAWVECIRRNEKASEIDECG